MWQFWSVNYICQVCKLHFYCGYVWNFVQYLYLSAYSKQWKWPKFSFCTCYMLYSHFTQNCIFLYFLEAKNPCFVTKNCSKFSYICVIYFVQKNSTIDFTKTFITQEWLVVESWPTLRWIAFLMLCLLVYNISSHFNELILAWSAYYKFFLSHK